MTKLTFLFLVISLPAFTQVNNRFLVAIDTKKVDSGKLAFSFTSLSYLKNNEYFAPTLDGYTLFGQWVKPSVVYRLHPKVMLKAGVFLNRTFGQTGLNSIQPTFSLEIQQKEWKYLAGNIDATLSHQLLEPLFNFERVITQPNETGLQAKHQTKNTFFDIWLDWRQFTKPAASQQEHIFFGLSSRHRLIDSTYLITQTTIYHEGGQNLSVKLPVKTYFNQALGIGYQHAHWRFEQYLLGNLEGKNKGYAVYSNLFWNFKWLEGGLAYFYGNAFSAPSGGDLFQSQSRKVNTENYYEKNRNLLLVKLLKEKEITKNLKFSLRFEPYYDFKIKKINHSESLFLVLVF